MEGAESAYAALSDLLICVVLDEVMVLKIFRTPYYIMGDLWVRTPNVGTVTREPGKKKKSTTHFLEESQSVVWVLCESLRLVKKANPKAPRPRRNPKIENTRTHAKLCRFLSVHCFASLHACVFVCRLCAFTATFRLFLQCPRLVSLKTRTRLCDFTHLQLSATRNPAQYRQFTQTIHN